MATAEKLTNQRLGEVASHERPQVVDAFAHADEENRHVWNAVSSLPSGERTAVTLYYRDEMPVSDIARALGVTAGTIKTLLFRARRHLRERMARTQTDGAASR